MKTNQKYYIVDLGLRRHLIAKRSYDLGFLLKILYILSSYAVDIMSMSEKSEIPKSILSPKRMTAIITFRLPIL